MHKLTSLPLAALLYLSLCGSLELPAEMPADAPLHFAEEANWPPFTQEAHGMASKGLSYELLQLIGQRLERSTDLELLPQQRLMQKLQRGEKDGVTLISSNEERAGFLVFSEPVLSKRGYLYYNVERPLPIEFSEWRDLQGLLIGIVIGHNYGEEFDRARRELPLQVVEVVSVQQLFQMALLGRVDAFLAIDLTAQELNQQPAFKGHIVHAARPYLESSYHLGLSRRSPAVHLLPQINQAIGELKATGELAQLLKRHGIQP
ncbi:transporter substrate-binding domain-containing protein [Pseudomonas sp. UL073]|uniref:Transporter substrate-binding domain-containing protein n=1 Tax=Zestomonas insulae TaxID=2809017 RepID=A0ABS2IC97_9GAMM|nr:transporter substrate-binding domain-containing protein [Pseudomonas insulae]MBM7059924.1 transporter substrate-binding domain-containing protein [Pseudomonas insulae]